MGEDKKVALVVNGRVSLYGNDTLGISGTHGLHLVQGCIVLAGPTSINAEPAAGYALICFMRPQEAFQGF